MAGGVITYVNDHQSSDMILGILVIVGCVGVVLLIGWLGERWLAADRPAAPRFKPLTQEQGEVLDRIINAHRESDPFEDWLTANDGIYWDKPSTPLTEEHRMGISVLAGMYVREMRDERFRAEAMGWW